MCFAIGCGFRQTAVFGEAPNTAPGAGALPHLQTDQFIYCPEIPDAIVRERIAGFC